MRGLSAGTSRVQRVEEAWTGGPQTIMVRGEPAVVVPSIDDFNKLRSRPKKLRILCTVTEAKLPRALPSQIYMSRVL